MRSLKLLPFLTLLGTGMLLGTGSALAQSTTYGIGRAPTDEEIRAWDISIGPTGGELPPGSGTSTEGALLYLTKACIACHGMAGVGQPGPRLIKRDAAPDADPWSLGRVLPIRSPYATTVWDYLNRGMPLGGEGTLTADEVYALTAYLLFINDLIEEDEVMDAESLPMVQMPNRDNWAPLPDWQPGQPRLPGYAH